MPTEDGIFTLGVTVVNSSWLKGDIYLLDPNAQKIPDFKDLKSIGSIYTPFLNVPSRDFQEGFPGITDRFEWFAIDYHGRFWISKPGKYRFLLKSDDGAKLYIDSKTIINNDGIHPASIRTGKANLAEGGHTIRISFFQGPRFQIALILAVSEPEQDKYRVFNIENYQPPAEKYQDALGDKAQDADKKSRQSR